MAMSASLACTPTTVNAGNVSTHVTLTVSNSAGSSVSVLGLDPYVVGSSGLQMQSPAVQSPMPALTAANQVVPNGGNQLYFWDVTFFDPQATGTAGSYYGGANNPASQTYNVGCVVTCADGTVLNPSTVAITVNPSPHS